MKINETIDTFRKTIIARFIRILRAHKVSDELIRTYIHKAFPCLHTIPVFTYIFSIFNVTSFI